MIAKNSLPTSSCFVVMPLGGIWDDYYTQIYVPAIQDAALRPERADDVSRRLPW